jgi:hypothetical protein
VPIRDRLGFPNIGPLSYRQEADLLHGLVLCRHGLLVSHEQEADLLHGLVLRRHGLLLRHRGLLLRHQGLLVGHAKLFGHDHEQEADLLLGLVLRRYGLFLRQCVLLLCHRGLLVVHGHEQWLQQAYLPQRLRQEDSQQRLRQQDSQQRLRQQDSQQRLRLQDSNQRLRQQDSHQRLRQQDSHQWLRQQDSQQDHFQGVLHHHHFLLRRHVFTGQHSNEQEHFKCSSGFLHWKVIIFKFSSIVATIIAIIEFKLISGGDQEFTESNPVFVEIVEQPPEVPVTNDKLSVHRSPNRSSSFYSKIIVHSQHSKFLLFFCKDYLLKLF